MKASRPKVLSHNVFKITFSYYDIETWKPSHGFPGKERTLSFDIVAKSKEEAEKIAHKIFTMSFGQFSYVYKDPKNYNVIYNTINIPWKAEIKENKDGKQ